DPLAPPVIRANYLESAADADVLIAGVALAQAMARTRALQDWLGDGLSPAALARTDAERLAALRQTASAIFHPAGTCKMGRDRMAVVDPELRVHGVQGLRVADASIMPTLVNGNPNAPCIMIGEKAADLIRRS